MQVWQRGTSFTAPSGYTADRWYVAGAGTQPNASQIASPISGYQYALQITGVAGNTQSYAYQKIESYNYTDLAAQNITVQMVLQASTAQTITILLAYANSQDNWGASTNISYVNFSVTTSAQVFTTTFTSLPSGAANGLELIIYPQGGGAFTSGTLKITGVQLEIGTSATPFERRLYGQELANCQRYYQRFVNSGLTYTSIGNGVSSGTTTIGRWNQQLFVPMRAAPTISFVNCVGFDGTVGGAVSNSNNYASTTNLDADLTTSAINGTTGRRATVLMLSNGYVELTGAEL